MSEIKEGAIVKCAFCRKEVAVQSITDYNGNIAYSLACFHRNAFCPTCQNLAKDISDSISEVEKHCVTCDPAIDDD